MISITRLLRPLVSALLIAAFVPSLAQAQENRAIDYETARRDRRLPAKAATGPIALDGKLDEPSWAGAPIATGFVQNDPREGEPATYDTEVKLLYDDRAIYIGVFAKDPEPGAIIINELRKDFNTASADGFQFVIDTFHDERNGYQFAINPAGAKWDSQMSNEGRDQNANWDGIWDVGTRIAEDGWYAEIEIPFKTLKFGPEQMQTWGINFQRRLRRKNENSYWSPLRRIHQLSRVSMAGTYEGLQGLRPGANIRVKPYALSNLNKVAGTSLDKDYDAGFDVKYGVTSGLTWDFTVNTDFSQVEADEQQVNLTRFSLFFPEKRDFFLENSGIFQFGGGGQMGGGGGGGGAGGRQNAAQDMRLFFSRQIGLSADGGSIPILAGTRLTGRVGGSSVGILNIQQREEGEAPSTNFTALRLRRDILANSDVGVVLLNKEQEGPLYNRVAGVDANFRFGFLTIDGYAVKTFTTDSLVAADGENFAARGNLSYQSRTLQFRVQQTAIGERFNDEMGFVPRLGVDSTFVSGGYAFRPARLAKIGVRETRPHWQMDRYSRRDGQGLESRYMDFHWPFNFNDGGMVEIGVNPNVEEIRSPFTINSARGVKVQPGHYDFNEFFVLWRTNSAARVSLESRFERRFYDGSARGVIGERPAERDVNAS